MNWFLLVISLVTYIFVKHNKNKLLKEWNKRYKAIQTTTNRTFFVNTDIITFYQIYKVSLVVTSQMYDVKIVTHFIESCCFIMQYIMTVFQVSNFCFCFSISSAIGKRVAYFPCMYAIIKIIQKNKNTCIRKTGKSSWPTPTFKHLKTNCFLFFRSAQNIFHTLNLLDRNFHPLVSACNNSSW